MAEKSGPRAQARKAGEAVRDKYGVEHLREIGRKGGDTIKRQKGPQYFAEIGRKGARSWRVNSELHQVFDALSNPVLLADRESRYVDANLQALNLLGYSLSELTGMKVSDVMASEPAWTDAEYRRYLEDGRWDGEVNLRCKNGEVITVLARARVIELDTGTAYVSVLKLKP